MICKSYDAHDCWYTGAFTGTENRELIQFDFSRLLWLGEHYGFFGRGILDGGISRDELISEISFVPYQREKTFLNPPVPEKTLLLFTDCNADEYMFFPLRKHSDRRLQFELFRFRLGFPGMYLAISDNCWCYMLKTRINTEKLSKLRTHHFPAIAPSHNPFGFTEMNKKAAFHSETVSGFAIAELKHLNMLKDFKAKNGKGKIRKTPTAKEALKIINAVNSGKPDKPDRAA